MVNNNQQVETKIVKGLLDFIILQMLKSESMYGYQIISEIRRSFGVNFSPSTIYPCLAALEENGVIESVWNVDAEHPRRVYRITGAGRSALNFTENSLQTICSKLNALFEEAPLIIVKAPK